MTGMFLMVFISCMIFFIYGLPMQIGPPKRIVEKMNSTRVNLKNFGIGIGDDIRIPGFNRKSHLRGAAFFTPYKWPNNIIPYDISSISDSKDREMITFAMNTLMYDTGIPIAGSVSRSLCVSFRPRQSTDETFLTIVYGSGCSASLGYWVNEILTMTLEKDCFTSGVIQHELMHVLGFDHEQNRPDRDNYVQINLENILEQYQFAFEKHTEEQSVNLNTPYDYYSIMHYGTYFFSKNGNPTIVSKQNNLEIDGYQPSLSPIDIIEVHRYYGCKQ